MCDEAPKLRVNKTRVSIKECAPVEMQVEVFQARDIVAVDKIFRAPGTLGS